MAFYFFCVLLVSSTIFGENSGAGVNLALLGISSQSSTYNELGVAENAIDGSSSSNYMSGHCTHTAQDNPSWWRVDLRKVYNVTRVKITNRGDCCHRRLNGAEIRIGLSPELEGTKNPKCAKIISLGRGKEEEYICGMVGQFVTVTIPDRPEYLTLCEVKVYGEEAIGNYTAVPSFEDSQDDPSVNLALRGISSQSSTYNYLGAAENAIDGSRSSDYMSGHCTHTAQDNPPWWRVDLRKVYNVTRVKITNRGDCCSDRINGAEIRIGLSPELEGTKNPKCAKIISLGRGKEEEYICGMVGQFVTVTIPDRPEYLTLCEVKVYGEEAIGYYTAIPSFEDSQDDPGVNLALRGISSQSSTYDYLGAAENAIDGSRSTNYLSKHCTHTHLDIEPWWKLDLGTVYNVTRVKVTNRGDCCNERLNGAEIRIGLSPDYGGTLNPKCAKIFSLGLGKEEEYICGMVGRYVTVTIPDTFAYLTLCEVKVYGKEVIGNYTAVPILEDRGDHPKATELQKIIKYSHAASNVALHGVVFQSSIDGGGDPQKAVDGSLKNPVAEDHCAKTMAEPDPWWVLDLKSDHRVFSVAVTSRTDCCKEELNGARIHIVNSLTSRNEITICGTVSSIGLGETFSFNCDGMVGRFVLIDIPGENRRLSLCEVQVFGVPTDKSTGPNWNGDVELQKQHHGAKNVAPQGTPSQSSYYDKNKAARSAIDGSLASNYFGGDCIHTKQDLNPWWRVDLKSKMVIQSVAITNRGDCCRERMKGAEIRIGNSKENGGIGNPRCGVVNRMNYGETLSFDCRGMEGQYVTITIPQREYLTLCEVQVFANPAEVQSTADTQNNKKKDLSSRSFFFPGENDDSYVHLSPRIPMNLKALTLCMKLSLDVPKKRETILFSYRTLCHDEFNLWIENSGKIGLYMSGDAVYFPPIDQKREWNHLCLTWEFTHGRTELWVNSRRQPTQFYSKRHQIHKGGIAIVGQDQDSLGGGFEAKQSYIGKIKDLNMWNRVLPPRAIRNVFRDEEVRKGNIFDWSSLTYETTGNVTIA